MILLLHNINEIMQLYKKLYQFSPAEVQTTLANAILHTYCYGLKILRTIPTTQEEATLQQHTHGKLLIIIPKKSGKATVRNKLRRRLKSAFYEHSLYKQPVIWTIIVRKAGALLSFDEIVNKVFPKLITQQKASHEK